MNHGAVLVRARREAPVTRSPVTRAEVGPVLPTPCPPSPARAERSTCRYGRTCGRADRAAVSRGSGGQVLESVVMVVIVALSGAVGGSLVQRRRLRRLHAAGRFQCALRVLKGAQPGLTTGWTHATCEPAPGRIRIVQVRQGLLVAAGRPPDIDVVTVDDHGFRRVTPLREVWSMAPGMVRVTVTTPTARLEVAVLGDAQAFVSALGRPPAGRGTSDPARG